MAPIPKVHQLTLSGQQVGEYVLTGSPRSIDFDGSNFWVGSVSTITILGRVYRFKNQTSYLVQTLTGAVSLVLHGLAMLGGGTYIMLKRTSGGTVTPRLELRKKTLAANVAIDTLSLPEADPGNSNYSSGICFDGRFVWYYDPALTSWVARDPYNWSVNVKSFETPDTTFDIPRGITYLNRLFYISCWHTDVNSYLIYIMKDTGELVDYLDVTSLFGAGEFPYDICNDGKYLYLVQGP